MSFLAIDPYIETHIVSPKEKITPGKDMVEWGTNNIYPEYLCELYDNVATLKSVIDGCVDYIAGDDVTIEPLRKSLGQFMNAQETTIAEQVRDIAQDYMMYGGFALQVIRGKDGKPSEVYYIDMRYLRMNKECNVFYYCEDWQRKGKKNVIIYPKFRTDLDWLAMTDEERNRHASSILFVKDNRKQTYPSPRYAASVKPCEIERCIDDFHLNSINNGFHGVDNAICTLGYQNQQGFNSLSSQLAMCCCDIERGIDSVNYNMATQACETRNTIQNSTRDIIDNANANSRAILDFLTNDKIATLTAENQNLKFAASQAQQNAFITANQEAQTAELIRRLGRDCPVPAYVVPNPNCCYNSNVTFSNGCGCGSF